MPLRFSARFAALIFLSPLASAQSFHLDAASFLGGEGVSLLEVYVSVGVAPEAFGESGDGFEARVPVRVSVAPCADGSASGDASLARDAVVSEALEVVFSVADTLLVQGEREDMRRVQVRVPAGCYTVAAQAGAPAEARERRVDVPDYSRSASISTVQLASSIARSEPGSGEFSKSGLDVQPNPSGMFAMDASGDGMRSVPYYAEVYGIGTAVDGDLYTVRATLADAQGPLKDHVQTSSRPVRPVDVVVGRFDISALPTGRYTLRIEALSEGGTVVTERSRVFHVVNPSR